MEKGLCLKSSLVSVVSNALGTPLKSLGKLKGFACSNVVTCGCSIYEVVYI